MNKENPVTFISDESRRICEIIKAEGTGSAQKWMTLAEASSVGSQTARAAIEGLLGHPVKTMLDNYTVINACSQLLSEGELALGAEHLVSPERRDADARNIVSNPISTLRKKAGMTQANLAQAANIQLSTLQKLENGYSSILGCRVETVKNIAIALGVDINVLIGGDC